MIVGNGVDIVKVSRIKKILNKDLDGFLTKIFRQEEIEYIKSKNYSPQTVSGLFAAKEAVSKITGTGIGKLNWKHIEICHDSNGNPSVQLHQEGLEIFRNLNIDNIQISISHEKKYAIAFAIGEFTHTNNITIPENIKNTIPKREKNSHKGDFGRVGIIAGSKGMTGAPYLSSMAALRSGSGLVYTIVPDAISSTLSTKLTEAIIRPVQDKGSGHFVLDSIDEIKYMVKDMDVLVIGPGLGVDEDRMELVKELLVSFHKPIVLDADGLNCILKFGLDILKDRKSHTIITPHVGEFSRLTGLTIDDIEANRVKYTTDVSKKYNIITVLKGAGTVVGNPDGQVYVNTTGNPGMATAGSGDVLTGMIASFVGQGIRPYEAAILGVYLHGMAGDLAKADKGEYGIIASDILNEIPQSIKKLQFA